MSTTGTNAAAMELSEGALKRRAADAAGFGVKEGQQVRGAFDAASILALEIDDRNKEARLEREKTDDNRFAEISGTRAGHIEVTGAGANEKARQIARDKQRIEDRAKTQVLLALQAQLDALGARIKVLDDEIDDILLPYLSDAERAYVDGIEDPETKAEEQMRLAREKLERGEMSQGEFDAFEERWEERQAKRADYNRVENIMKNGTREEQLAAARNENIDAVGEGRHNLLGDVKREVTESLERRDDVGNVAHQSVIQTNIASFGGSIFGNPALDQHKGIAKNSFDAAVADSEAASLEVQKPSGQEPLPAQLPRNDMG